MVTEDCHNFFLHFFCFWLCEDCYAFQPQVDQPVLVDTQTQPGTIVCTITKGLSHSTARATQRAYIALHLYQLGYCFNMDSGTPRVFNCLSHPSALHYLMFSDANSKEEWILTDLFFSFNRSCGVRRRSNSSPILSSNSELVHSSLLESGHYELGVRDFLTLIGCVPLEASLNAELYHIVGYGRSSVILGWFPWQRSRPWCDLGDLWWVRFARLLCEQSCISYLNSPYY